MDEEEANPDDEELADRIARLVDQAATDDVERRLLAIRQIGEVCLEMRERARMAIPTLVSCLSDADKEIGESALFALSWCAPASIESLIDCLASSDARVRERACYALGNIGDAAATACDVVRPLLNDDIREVRLRAAWALGLMHDTSNRTVTALLAMAESQCAKERGSSLHALGNIGTVLVDPAPLRARQQTIVGALEDADDEVRRCALYALEGLELDTPRRVQLLTQRLAVESSDEVRTAAIRQLKDLAPTTDLSGHVPLMCDIVRRGEHDARDMCEVLALIGPSARSAIPCLIEALRSDDGVVVIAAAEALWVIDRRVNESLPELERIFDLYDESVCHAIYLIGPSASPLIHKVIGALQSEHWDLQWAAADALGAIASSDPKILDVLTSALGHPSPIVASAATGALAKLGPAAVPALMAILNDRNDNRGEYAADAIGRIGQHAAPATDLLRRNLTSHSFALAAWSAIALAKAAGDAAAVPLLIQLLSRDDRPDLRHQAALGLAMIGPPAIAAIDALKIALDDSDDQVRAAATAAVAAVNAKSN